MDFIGNLMAIFAASNSPNFVMFTMLEDALYTFQLIQVLYLIVNVNTNTLLYPKTSCAGSCTNALGHCGLNSPWGRDYTATTEIFASLKLNDVLIRDFLPSDELIQQYCLDNFQMLKEPPNIIDGIKCICMHLTNAFDSAQ
jgi:hypothetical protein